MSGFHFIHIKFLCEYQTHLIIDIMDDYLINLRYEFCEI